MGLIDKANALMLINGNVLRERFSQMQNKLMKSDINNCSKTAWVMPKYLAEATRRSLKRVKKHSDVSVDSYTTPQIAFIFDRSYIPSTIIRRISLITAFGIFEWWPNFINQSDVSIGNENLAPTKPSMTGNILVIFFFLGAGMSFAFVCTVLEMCIFRLSFCWIGFQCFTTVLSHIFIVVKTNKKFRTMLLS